MTRFTTILQLYDLTNIKLPLLSRCVVCLSFPINIHRYGYELFLFFNNIKILKLSIL